MTVAQETPNGHRLFSPPCSAPGSQEKNPGKDSTNNNNAQLTQPATGVVEPKTAAGITAFFRPEEVTPATQTFPASACHVPPARYAPKPHPYRGDDTLDSPPETTPLPERCQFMFSDGRQCTMARSEIHPSLCRFHSEREEQLFGGPVPGGRVVGASLDLPELYSACGDLSTARGVRRALAQVFRLLAQRRISRQEAATFAKLGQLLLQSISAAGAPSAAIDGFAEAKPQASLGPYRNENSGPPKGEDLRLAAHEQPAGEVVERQKDVANTALLAAASPEPGAAASCNHRSRRSHSPGFVHHAPPTLHAPLSPHEHLSKARPQATQNEHLQNARDKVVHNEYLQENGRGGRRLLNPAALNSVPASVDALQRMTDNHENGRKT